MKKKFLAGKIYVLITAMAIGLGLFAWKNFSRPPKEGTYDAFAQCLAEKHAVMYGAYWCPHCQNQKKLFGSSFAHARYEECAIRGSRELTQVCKDAGVQRFPTWIFADGSRTEGEMPLAALSEKTSCLLP